MSARLKSKQNGNSLLNMELAGEKIEIAQKRSKRNPPSDVPPESVKELAKPPVSRRNQPKMTSSAEDLKKALAETNFCKGGYLPWWLPLRHLPRNTRPLKSPKL